MIPTSVIIPAAGNSSRFGNIPKQLQIIAGKPLIYFSLKEFQINENVESIIIATKKEFIDQIKKISETYKFNKVKNIIEGGLERQQSVMNAANFLDNNSEIILVHDAARPFITQEVINLVISEAYSTGAAIIGLQVNDTIKKVTSDKKINQTVDREGMYLAQTPQAFRKDIFQKMKLFVNQNNFIGTDEAMIAEKLNIFPTIVNGSALNFKITKLEDLKIAEKLLELKDKI
ncbi:MAG: 2-C-methyl-D-erythritol 4-phosphate cytidylyltransferase [Bacteroidetes bacterium]|nr:2-C-methyl-D-erythritol 4-phosphate cytidylyltransferase [Bacteroidota bacterium]